MIMFQYKLDPTPEPSDEEEESDDDEEDGFGSSKKKEEDLDPAASKTFTIILPKSAILFVKENWLKLIGLTYKLEDKPFEKLVHPSNSYDPE